MNDLKMIPSNKKQLIADKLFLHGLLEKDKPTTSFADDVRITNKTLEIMIEFGSFTSFLENNQGEDIKVSSVNIYANNGSSVTMINGNNNDLN